MSNELFIALLFIGLVVWWIFKRNNTDVSVNNLHNLNQDAVLDEETIAKIQLEFEKELGPNHQPDSLSGKEIYIFKNLMSPWYEKLSSKYRYEETKVKKIKQDWIMYMAALKDRSTYNFLSLESEDEESQDAYYEDHVIASKKVFSIEDAFASSLGKEAENELDRIRKLNSLGNFSRNGELAPSGYIYDIADVLKKEK